MKVWYCCVFFFFKQKTAYELCGRDWSSDVCSSDLTDTDPGSTALPSSISRGDIDAVVDGRLGPRSTAIGKKMDSDCE